MVMRVASIQEDQYKICEEHGLWGDDRSSMKKWKPGDFLLFKVGNEIWSLAEVSGEPFEDDLLIWDNGFYPYRVPLKFIRTYKKNMRGKVFESFKIEMLKEYGNKYGWVILNKQPLKEDIATMLANYPE